VAKVLPTALVCVFLSAAAAEARMVTERDSRGATRAELSYDRSGDGFTTTYRHFRIRVLESGEKALDRMLTCGRRCAPAGYGRSRSIHVRDLNGGRPEALVDLDTGGGYCCFVTVVERRAGRGYATSSKSWGPKRATLENAGAGRGLEFISHDDRLLSPYGCNFCWRFLPHVWRFGRDGRFRDVTRRFPAHARPSARALRRRYFHASRRHGDVKAALAGYVAATHLLGTPRTGWWLARRALRRGELADRRGRYDFCPCGAGWIPRLRRLLDRWGYR
jgi:hypothetical protein